MKKKFDVGGSPKKLILHLGGYLERGPDIDLTPTTQGFSFAHLSVQRRGDLVLSFKTKTRFSIGERKPKAISQ
jgi:hypothetical protein